MAQPPGFSPDSFLRTYNRYETLYVTTIIPAEKRDVKINFHKKDDRFCGRLLACQKGFKPDLLIRNLYVLNLTNMIQDNNNYLVKF